MGTRHLKRLAMPKSWQIDRKERKYVSRPNPGPHAHNLGLPINVVLRDMLKLAKTTRETKRILFDNDVLIDKVRRKNPHLIVGLMDTVSLPAIKQYYRLIINTKGKLDFQEIKEKEANLKPCKIIGKTFVKGKCQLNLHDGKNILVDKDSYKVGDSVVLDLAAKKISAHLKLDKGSKIMLVGGKSIGHIGEVNKIEGTKVLYKGTGGVFETLKKYAYVVGLDKPVITVKNE